MITTYWYMHAVHGICMDRFLNFKHPYIAKGEISGLKIQWAYSYYKRVPVCVHVHVDSYEFVRMPQLHEKVAIKSIIRTL